MTITPVSSTRLAVLPIVDYEPPARAVRHSRPSVPARPRRGRAGRPRPGRAAPMPLPPALRAVTAFADAALRRVLEVVDLRRPAAHLYPLLAPGLVDSVLSVHRAAPARTGVATLQRVRAQLVGPDDPPGAAEVFGTYRRGGRIHAVAGRVQRVPAGTGPGWQMVALHIG